MTTTSITHDERTVAVENASYRWGYLLLAFGLLLSTAYRSFVRAESSWDLLALVVLSGVVTTAFQWRRRTLSRRSALFAAMPWYIFGGSYFGHAGQRGSGPIT